MNHNLLYAVVGGIAVIVGLLGYQYYQDTQTSSIELNVGEGGVSIETK